MKTQSVSLALPILATSTSAPVDPGSGFGGFLVQFVGVAAAAGATYSLLGSLDGKTWIDITNNLKDVGNGGAAVTVPIGGDVLLEYRERFPGLVQFVCKTAPSAPPTNAPQVWVGYQDTTQA